MLTYCEIHDDSLFTMTSREIIDDSFIITYCEIIDDSLFMMTYCEILHDSYIMMTYCEIIDNVTKSKNGHEPKYKPAWIPLKFIRSIHDFI